MHQLAEIHYDGLTVNEVRQMQEQAEAVAAEGGDKGDDAGGDDLAY